MAKETVAMTWPYPEIPVPGTPLTLNGRHVGEVTAVSDATPPTVTAEVTDPDAIKLVTAEFDDLGIGLGDAQ